METTQFSAKKSYVVISLLVPQNIDKSVLPDPDNYVPCQNIHIFTRGNVCGYHV